MPALTPERADDIIAGWLAGTDVVDGWHNPAGPLFISGKYAEADITMAGFDSDGSLGPTGCGPCTGSVCNTIYFECW